MKKTILFLILIILFLPCFVVANNKVDINTASLEELQTITGIGPVYAQRIIDERPFSSLDDLVKVSGIGEKTLQKIKEQGLAFVEYVEEDPVGAESPDPKSETKKSVEARPQRIFSDGIIFTKIMPSPEGADAENEWIEIENNNDFEVDLSGWIIRDKKGTVKEYALSQKMAPSGVLKITRPESKITLNNSGDGLELLSPNEEIVDSVDFGKAQTGAAYIKTFSGWQWDIPETKKLPEDGPLDVLEKESSKTETKKTVIDLSGKSQNSAFSKMLTGLFIASLFAIIFIILKRKLDGF